MSTGQARGNEMSRNSLLVTPLDMELPKRLRGVPPRPRPILAAAEEVRHLHDLERAGESDWTPWIAISGLLLFFVTIGVLMFGIVEGASRLLASAPFGWA